MTAADQSRRGGKGVVEQAAGATRPGAHAAYSEAPRTAGKAETPVRQHAEGEAHAARPIVDGFLARLLDVLVQLLVIIEIDFLGLDGNARRRTDDGDLCGGLDSGTAERKAAGVHGEGDDQKREDEAQQACRETLRLGAEHHRRQAEEQVAGDAADAGRQRPCPHHRKKGQGEGSGHGRQQPRNDRFPGEPAGLAEDQPPRPDDRGEEQDQSRQGRRTA